MNIEDLLLKAFCSKMLVNLTSPFLVELPYCQLLFMGQAEVTLSIHITVRPLVVG